MTDDRMDDIRRTILEAALPQVAGCGWSERLVDGACRATGLDRGSVDLAFPGGAADILKFASQESDRALVEHLQNVDLAAMKIRERITYAVRRRIEAMSDHKSAVARTLSFLALPQNAPLGAQLLYGTMDSIWHGIGDRSTDFNYYTKRATLCGVYSSTVLFWMTDDSPDNTETLAFLDRRIADVMEFEKFKGRVRKATENLPDPERILSMVLRPFNR